MCSIFFPLQLTPFNFQNFYSTTFNTYEDFLCWEVVCICHKYCLLCSSGIQKLLDLSFLVALEFTCNGNDFFPALAEIWKLFSSDATELLYNKSVIAKMFKLHLAWQHARHCQCFTLTFIKPFNNCIGNWAVEILPSWKNVNDLDWKNVRSFFLFFSKMIGGVDKRMLFTGSSIGVGLYLIEAQEKKRTKKKKKNRQIYSWMVKAGPTTDQLLTILFFNLPILHRKK